MCSWREALHPDARRVHGRRDLPAIKLDRQHRQLPIGCPEPHAKMTLS